MARGHSRHEGTQGTWARRAHDLADSLDIDPPISLN